MSELEKPRKKGRRVYTPEDRANGTATTKRKAILRVRKGYKRDITKNTKFAPGEAALVKDMAVVLRLANYTYKQIAQIIGVSETQARNYLAEPQVAERLLMLRDRLPQAALDLLQSYMIEAVQAVVDVMRRTEDDALVLKAAAEIFDRAGLPKASRTESKVEREETARHTFMPGEGFEQAFANATPEIQEKAAQLEENFMRLLEEASAPKTKPEAEIQEGTEVSDGTDAS